MPATSPFSGDHFRVSDQALRKPADQLRERRGPATLALKGQDTDLPHWTAARPPEDRADSITTLRALDESALDIALVDHTAPCGLRYRPHC